MNNSKPRTTGEKHPLPFEILGPRAFERLCLWLVQREGFEMVVGAAGADQGRDIAACEGDKKWIFQCKNVRKLGPQALQHEIDKILSLAPNERPDVLVFVAACPISAKARKGAQDRCRGAAIECRFWAVTELDEMVKRHADIVREFFQIEQYRAQERNIRISVLSILAIGVLGLVLLVAQQLVWALLLLSILVLGLVTLIVLDFRSRRAADMVFIWRESSEQHTVDHDQFEINFSLANRRESRIYLNRVVFTLASAWEGVTRMPGVYAMKVSRFDDQIVAHLSLEEGRLKLPNNDTSHQLFSGYRLQFDANEVLDFHIHVTIDRPHEDELKNTIHLQMNYGIVFYYDGTNLEESVISVGGSLGIGPEWDRFGSLSGPKPVYHRRSSSVVKGPVRLI